MHASNNTKGWAVWVVGLPGSGKSSLARWLCETVRARGHDVLLLQMDRERKKYLHLAASTNAYSEAEREQAYARFAAKAAELAAAGHGVIMDGSACKISMRRVARERIRRFAEIHVKCPLEVAMQREARRPQGMVMADLYRKALERQATGRQFPGLGQVIGVDLPFEEDAAAECVIDNTDISKEETRARALAFLEAWLACSSSS